MVNDKGTGKGSNQVKLAPLPNKGSVAYCDMVTRVKGGQVFTRRLKVITYRYQKCRWVYIDKNGQEVRKLVILKTLKRKPRGAK